MPSVAAHLASGVLGGKRSQQQRGNGAEGKADQTNHGDYANTRKLQRSRSEALFSQTIAPPRIGQLHTSAGNRSGLDADGVPG
jgi:hypothetical protein